MTTLPAAPTPRRPVLHYHGGKWRLAPWIIGYFAAHRTYVEPFAGGASVLLRKPRSYAEVYNDIDGQMVNLFRVLRDPAQGRELIRQITLTPYARAEFDLSYLTADDPIEQARRTLFRAAAGHSSVGATSDAGRTGFRANVTRSGSTPADDWESLPAVLDAVVQRLRGVIIENLPAVEVMRRYDSPAALHYVDPPYLPETRHGRWAGHAYRHEMPTDDEHRELAEVLHGLAGQVVISHYPHPLYDEIYADWTRYDRAAHSDRASDRVECIWVKPGATPQLSLAMEGL